jgi:uncharacterized protein YrrD
MLRSINQLYDGKLGASDGEIGHIKDFYFDDENWAIRYLVADTGLWLPGRQVLLTPHSLGRLDQMEKVIRVNLTRKQIEDSPSIESHKPLSRQYEETYYRYFGWPYYWQGNRIWGMSGFPILELPPNRLADVPIAASGRRPERPDDHLRSTRSVNGYQLKATDGIVGPVCDFMMDAQSWVIGELVIKTGHRFSGHEVLIPTKAVDSISYEDSTVLLNCNTEAVEQGPAHQLAPSGASQ